MVGLWDRLGEALDGDALELAREDDARDGSEKTGASTAFAIVLIQLAAPRQRDILQAAERAYRCTRAHAMWLQRARRRRRSPPLAPALLRASCTAL